ncbi:MAG: DUF1844 domain-containing protein [Phycisphaerae bacterium]
MRRTDAANLPKVSNMAELHIDSDWKKQAQEEKRRLAEQAEKDRAARAKQAPRPPAGPSAGQPQQAASQQPGQPAAGERQTPAPSFSGLVQTLTTQAFYYLGELAPAGAQPTVNLDMAKHNIDLLSILEDKTRGNLTEDEQRTLDVTLYEARMRFVAVAQRYIQ